MSNAIDHPPGSPVFEALKERIEALPGRVFRFTGDSHARTCIMELECGASKHRALVPATDAYAELVRFAELAGIELED